MKTAEYWIEHLGLQPHPEGGYYKETYRSDEVIEADALPPNFQQDDAEVIVKFKKTGKKSSLEQGTGLEQVRILNIRPK